MCSDRHERIKNTRMRIATLVGQTDKKRPLKNYCPLLLCSVATFWQAPNRFRTSQKQRSFDIKPSHTGACYANPLVRFLSWLPQNMPICHDISDQLPLEAGIRNWYSRFHRTQSPQINGKYDCFVYWRASCFLLGVHDAITQKCHARSANVTASECANNNIESNKHFQEKMKWQ